MNMKRWKVTKPELSRDIWRLTVNGREKAYIYDMQVAEAVRLIPQMVAALEDAAFALEDEVNAMADPEHPMSQAHAKAAENARIIVDKVRGR